MYAVFSCSSHLSQCEIVKNLMYGFGDDRNPANDTVNVMEEILIEYITDVVRVSLFFFVHQTPTSHSV